MQNSTIAQLKGTRFAAAIAAAAVAALAVIACTPDTDTPDTSTPNAEKPTVVTTVYPITYFAQEIAGDQADVTSVFGGNTDPHLFEPTASDIIAIQSADLFVYHSNQFDGWVPDILDGNDVTALPAGGDFSDVAKEDDHGHEDEEGDEHGHEDEDGDEHADEDGDEHADEEGDEHADEEGDEHADEDGDEHADEEGDEHADEEGDEHADEEGDEHADEDGDEHEEDEHGHEDEKEGDEHGHEHEGEDFHTWLNPADAIGIATRIRDSLLENLPADAADDINSNADDLIMRLRTLDSEFDTQFASCAHDTFVISHATFAHFAEQYGFTQLAVRSAENTEQSISTVTGIRSTVSGEGIQYILSESPDGAADGLLQTIADGAEAEILSVSIMEGGEDDGFTGDYFQRMRSNAEAFNTALDCS